MTNNHGENCDTDTYYPSASLHKLTLLLNITALQNKVSQTKYHLSVMKTRGWLSHFDVFVGSQCCQLSSFNRDCSFACIIKAQSIQPQLNVSCFPTIFNRCLKSHEFTIIDHVMCISLSTEMCNWLAQLAKDPAQDPGSGPVNKCIK